MSTPNIAAERKLLWYALYGEIPGDLTSTDLAAAYERLQTYIDRFGEYRTLQKLRRVMGLEIITLEMARTLLDRRIWEGSSHDRPPAPGCRGR